MPVHWLGRRSRDDPFRANPPPALPLSASHTSYSKSTSYLAHPSSPTDAGSQTALAPSASSGSLLTALPLSSGALPTSPRLTRTPSFLRTLVHARSLSALRRKNSKAKIRLSKQAPPRTPREHKTFRRGLRDSRSVAALRADVDVDERDEDGVPPLHAEEARPPAPAATQHLSLRGPQRAAMQRQMDANLSLRPGRRSALDDVDLGGVAFRTHPAHGVSVHPGPAKVVTHGRATTPATALEARISQTFSPPRPAVDTTPCPSTSYDGPAYAPTSEISHPLVPDTSCVVDVGASEDGHDDSQSSLGPPPRLRTVFSVRDARPQTSLSTRRNEVQPHWSVPSPERPQKPTRHMSSPARMQPRTEQHPHRMPLPIRHIHLGMLAEDSDDDASTIGGSASRTTRRLVDTPDVYGTRDDEDFARGARLAKSRFSDEFAALVAADEMPDASSTGRKPTPRVFSRDATRQSSATPTTSARGGAPSPASYKDDGRRSSSPFEVKFHPTITKRISLDAFGAPVTARDEVEELTEILEDSPATDEGLSDDGFDRASDESGALEPHLARPHAQLAERFEGHLLSTVDEGITESSIPHIPDLSSARSTRAAFQLTRTPASPVKIDDREIASNPVSLTPGRKHVSAPPSPEVSEVRALRRELEETRDMLENAILQRTVTEDALEEKDEQVARLKTRNDELEQALLQTREAVSANETNVDLLQKDHANMTARLAAAERELADATFARRDDADHVTQVDAECELLKLAITQLQERCKAVEALRDEMVSHRGRAVELEATGTARQARIVDLEAQLRAVQSEADDLRTSGQELVRLVEEKDRSAAAGTAELRAQLEAATSLAQARQAELEAQAAEHRTATREVAATLAAREATVQELLDKLRAARFAIDEQKAGHEAELGQAADRGEEMRIKNGELEAKIEQIEADTKQKEAVGAALRERLARVEEEKRAWEEERAETMDMVHGERAQDMADLHAQLDAQADQLASAKHTMTSLRALVDELHGAISLRDHAIDDLRAELGGARASSDDLRAELGNVRASARQAEDEAAAGLADATRHAKDAERATAHLYDQLSDLSRVNGDLSAQLAAAIEAREAHAAHAADARSRLATYLAEIDRLKLAAEQRGAELRGVRAASAAEGIELAKARKQLAEAEHDRELLAVALDSKETELRLALATSTTARRAPPAMGGTPHTPKQSRKEATSPSPMKRLVAGTAVASSGTSSASSAAPRALTPARTAVAAKKARRESGFVLPACTPAVPRSASATPAPVAAAGPLGMTARHNARHPFASRRESAILDGSKIPGPRAASGGAGRGGAAPVAHTATGERTVRMQSSMPLLRRKDVFG
ncbi:hypothetical protein Q5752_005466 [Cryptotrichosporon argae]